MNTPATTSPQLPPVQGGRCRTLTRTMMLVVGLSAAGWAADTTPSATISANATGIIGTAQVTSAQTVIFTVVFDQPVFPLRLRNTAWGADATGAPTFAQLYDLFTVTGGTAAVDRTIKQLNGKTFEITVANIADDTSASVAVNVGTWAHVNNHALTNLATAAVSVKTYLPANKPTDFTVATPDYTGFLNSPSLAGQITKNATGAATGNNPNGAVVTLVGGGATGTAVATGSDDQNAVWVYTPVADPPTGLISYTISAKDAAGTALTAQASTNTGAVYVWKQPVVSQVKQVSTGSLVPFADNMFVSNLRPSFAGFAGIGESSDATEVGTGNNVQVKVEIFNFGYTNDGNDNNDTLAVPALTITPGANDATADDLGMAWTAAAPATDLPATPANGLSPYTLRITTSVVGAHPSLNSIATIKTFNVTDAAVTPVTAPTLTIVSTRPQHIPKILVATASTWPSGVPLPTKTSPTDSDVSHVADSTTFKMYIDSGSGFGSVVAGKVYVDTTPNPDEFHWIADAPLVDGSYRFKATVTDASGATSPDSVIVPAIASTAHVIATPTPVLAITGAGAGTPGVGAVPGTPVPVAGTDPDYQYILATRKPTIKVSNADPDGTGPVTTGNALTANGTLTVWAVSRGTSGTLFDATGGAVTIDATTNSRIQANTDFQVAKRIAGTYNSGAGTWTPDEPLEPGSYSLSARWEDNDSANGTMDAIATTSDALFDQYIAGNSGAKYTDDASSMLSVASNLFNFRIISTVDRPAITLVKDGADSVTLLDTSTATTVIIPGNEIVLHGTGNPGATLRVFRNGALMPTKVISTPSTGAWTYSFKVGAGVGDATELPAGTNKLTVQQVDLSGTASLVTTTSINVVVDAHVPAAPVVLLPVSPTTLSNLQPTFSGTTEPNASVYVLIGGVTTNVNADGDDQVVTASSTGAWSMTLSSANKLTTATNYDGTTVAKTIKFKAVSPAGIASPYTTARLVNVLTPNLAIRLDPLAKGTAAADGTLTVDTTGLPAVANAYAVGNTAIKVKKVGGTNGTILKGDSITIAGNTYNVAIGANVVADGALSSITLAAGLKAAIVKAAVVPLAINANPNAPVSLLNGNAEASSLSTVLLTATMTDGSGHPLSSSVLPTVFTKSSITCINGTVASVTKGSGKAGEQPTNVWTIAVTPSTAPTAAPVGKLEVSIPAGAFSNTPGKYISAIAVGGGKDYSGTPTLRITGAGFEASATITAANANAAPGAASATIVDGGWGFSTPPVITVLPAPGAGAKATAGFTNATTITIANPSGANQGAGYTSAPTVRISSGEDATATAVIGTGANVGLITALTRTSGGKYYSQVPTVAISAPVGGGTNATATATIANGAVTGFVMVNKGTGYDVGEAVTVTITATGTGCTATATLTADKVTAITVNNTSSAGYTAAPNVIITTGSGATATATMADGTLVFNQASDSDTDASTVAEENYQLTINRSAPTVTWKWAAEQPVDSTSQLRPVTKADGSSYAGGDALTGAFFVNQQVVASTTTYKLRLGFSPPLETTLATTDFTAVGCDVTAVSAVAGGAAFDDFLVTVTRGTKTGPTMSVTMKAGLHNSDSTPVIKNLASTAFVATLVSQTSAAPVIASAVGALTPAKGSKVPSYPMTVTFPNPVRSFAETNLTVTNGVITKFAGTGKVYSFLLTPGEGQVTVVYDNTATNKVYDVAGNEVIDSNTFTRLVDSTQPVIVQVSSPVFKKLNTSGTPASATATLTVSTITVTNGGSGYSTAPAVTFAGANGGSGATATAVLDGDVVSGIVVTSGGTGYTGLETLTIAAPGAGVTATATASMGVGAITTVAAGAGFAQGPTVTLSGGGGTGASVISTVDVNGAINGYTVVPGTGYTSAPTLTVHNSIKPMDGSTVLQRFPVRVTFSEALTAFPTASLVASATGLATGTSVSLAAPKAVYDAAPANAKPVGPQAVVGTGGTVYEFDLVVPTALTSAGSHDVRLVVPSQGVTDGATNSSQASQVFSFTYDLVNGMPTEVKLAPIFSNG